MWLQKEMTLAARPRGFHLITDEIQRAMPPIEAVLMGTAHFFIKHSSASLSINENADPTVRTDMEAHFNRMIPEDTPYFEHTYEGADDMPAHLKNVMIGSSLLIPVTRGRLNLGTWQGIYLAEHRNRAAGRTVVITVQGTDQAQK